MGKWPFRYVFLFLAVFTGGMLVAGVAMFSMHLANPGNWWGLFAIVVVQAVVVTFALENVGRMGRSALSHSGDSRP